MIKNTKMIKNIRLSEYLKIIIKKILLEIKEKCPIYLLDIILSIRFYKKK